MTTLPDGYIDNYDQIAREHLRGLREKGENPWMKPELVETLEAATLAIIESHTSPGDWILDAGCGPGGLLQPLQRRVRHGIDISADYLQIARTRYEHVHLGPIEQMPYDGGRFDLVVCADVLEHIPDINAGIREILRVLRRKGILVIRVPENEDLGVYLDYRYRFVHLRSLTGAGLHLLLERVFNCEVLETSSVAGEVHAVARKR